MTDNNPDVRKPLILIAEDVESNYKLLEIILKKEYDLLWAKNGREAVDFAMEHKPDAILMDIKMPVMDGIEALKEIRRHTAELPVIMQTAYAFDTDRRTAEGIVYATKPLSYQGQLIENFSVRFEKGRAVEVKAEKGQDVLEQIISMDEGCHYLGECALVPKESPIHQSGLLFYNTLFDENAACHLALGFGFDECVKGFENMTKEELYEIGVNDAGNHTDFMIGSDDLSIDGVDEHGNVHPIFRNGTWAF